MKYDFTERINSLIRQILNDYEVEFYDPEADRSKDSNRLKKWIKKKSKFSPDFLNQAPRRILIRQLVNFNQKLIANTKRRVKLSSKLKRHLSNSSLKLKLKKIIKAFEEGKDTNPYLSRGVFIAYEEDQLVASWNIYHLHITSKRTQHKYFMDRSDKLLMVYVDNESVYLLDVRDHKEGDDEVNLVWSRQELVKIIELEFPEVMSRFVLNGALGPSIDEKLTDKQVREMRKHGISTLLRGEGDVAIAPMGGGIATDGSSVQVTMHSSQINKMFYDWEKHLSENEEEIIKDFHDQGLNTTKIEFSLEHGDTGFYIVEHCNGVKLSGLNEVSYFNP